MEDHSRTPVILKRSCRTPIGRFLSGLSALAALLLASSAVREAVQRSGIEGGEVDEVILGNVLSVGLGQAPARQATIRGGLSATLPAVTVNKVCGSGLKAVMLTAQAIRAGDARVIMASGARDMVTLLSAMADRDVRTGLATMCLGGGNAVAMSVARTPGGGVRP